MDTVIVIRIPENVMPPTIVKKMVEAALKASPFPLQHTSSSHAYLSTEQTLAIIPVADLKGIPNPAKKELN